MNAIYRHLSDKFLLSAVFGVSLLIASSCVKTLDEQPITLAGKWAKVDGAFMTSEYVEFRSGNMKSFVSESRKLIYDGTVWNSSQNDFDNKWNERYSVYDGTLIVAGEELGKLSIDKDTMTVGNTRYISIDDFKSEQYSRIEIKSEEPVKCGYAGGSYSFIYEIDNPLEWNSISAKSMVDWISSVKCGDETVSFVVEPSPENEKRNGSILLSYPNADDVSVSVFQTNLSSVKITKTLLNADYISREYNVNYTIENPSEGGSLTYSTESSWIRDIRVDPEQISITLDENNTGNVRTGSILFSYPDADDVELIVNQNFYAPGITVIPASLCCDYSSGDYSLVYTIANPREGESLQVTCPDLWITDISVSSDRVSFRVSENQTFLPRQSKLLLGYANIIKEVSVVQKSRYVDLSSSGTANCYIVSEVGDYIFAAVKGNGNESVGSVSSVDVLWESFGTNIIPQVGDLIAYSEYSDGFVYFSIVENFREGNAVIAARDASGKILWSWHIWLTDQPEDQEYNNGAGTMMDRNLGATSATPGSVGALGLLYQWGRKDPFLGSSSISSSTRAGSTISWPSPVESTESTGTIDYAVSNPVTFITSGGSSNQDWYYTGSSSTDNTRWQSSKTIYDPCPPGYRVPDGGRSGGIWSKAFGFSSTFDEKAYDSTNEGFNFGSSGAGTEKLSNSVSVCWYPAAGCLISRDGSLRNVGNNGSCGSCSPSGSYACSLYFDSNGSVSPSGSSNRASGYSVRCLKE